MSDETQTEGSSEETTQPGAPQAGGVEASVQDAPPAAEPAHFHTLLTPDGEGRVEHPEAGWVDVTRAQLDVVRAHSGTGATLDEALDKAGVPVPSKA